MQPRYITFEQKKPGTNESFGVTRYFYQDPNGQWVEYVKDDQQPPIDGIPQDSSPAAQGEIRRIDSSQMPTERLQGDISTFHPVNTTAPVGGVDASGNSMAPGTPQPATSTLNPGGVTGSASDTVGGRPTWGTGQPVETPVALNTGTIASTPPSPPSPASQQDYDIAQLLSSSTLSEDEKKLIQTIYQYSVDKNEDAAKALIAKLELGKQYADPIYQQKFNLAKDTLERGLASLYTALQYDEQIRQRALERLQSDIIYAKDNLSFQEQQMLGQLERSLGLKLESTRQNLASRGFTDSTRRAEAEQLLQETTGELRESTEREFAAKQKALADQGMRAAEDTAAEIKRLQELNLQQKKDISRQAESQLGTGNLPPLEGVTPVGGLTGDLELQRKQDLAQFVY